jgi:hypothetical protein
MATEGSSGSNWSAAALANQQAAGRGSAAGSSSAPVIGPAAASPRFLGSDGLLEGAVPEGGGWGAFKIPAAAAAALAGTTAAAGGQPSQDAPGSTSVSSRINLLSPALLLAACSGAASALLLLIGTSDLPAPAKLAVAAATAVAGAAAVSSALQGLLPVSTAPSTLWDATNSGAPPPRLTEARARLHPAAPPSVRHRRVSELTQDEAANRSGRRANTDSTGSGASSPGRTSATGSSGVLSQYSELKCCILIKPLAGLRHQASGGSGAEAVAGQEEQLAAAAEAGAAAGAEGGASLKAGLVLACYQEVSCGLVVRSPVMVEPLAGEGEGQGAGPAAGQVLPPGACGAAGTRQCLPLQLPLPLPLPLLAQDTLLSWLAPVAASRVAPC